MILESLKTLILFTAPGYLAASADKRLSGNERLAAAPIYSALLYGSVFLFAHLLGGQPGFPATVIVFALAGAYAASKKASYKAPDNALRAILAAAFVLRVGVLMLSPYPHSGDSTVHYAYAKSFLSNHWYTAGIVDNYWTPYTGFPFPGSYRPPLEDFTHSLGMLFNSADFASAATSSIVFGVFVVAFIYLLAERMFSRKAAHAAAVIGCVNFFLMSRSAELEPRMVVSCFVLAMVYFSLKGRIFWAYSAASAGLAYLTHYSAVWFIAPIALYYGWMGRKRASVRWLYPAIGSFIIVFPWLLRNTLLFESPVYSTARYAAFVDNAEKLLSLSPPTMAGYLNSLGGGIKGCALALAYRVINVVTSYVPPPQKMVQYGLTWTLSNSIVNHVNVLVFLAAAYYLSRNVRKVKDTPVFLTVAFTSLFGPLLHGFPNSDGVSASVLNPLVPVYIVYAAAYLSKAKPWIVAAVSFAILAQSAWLLYDRAQYAPNSLAMGLIAAKVPAGEAVMSVQGHEINFYTGRNAYITPYAPFNDIVGTAKRLGVRYYVLTPVDVKLRDVDGKRLEKVADRLGEKEGYAVYEFR